MLRFLIAIVLWTVMPLRTWCCDICACNSSMQLAGLSHLVRQSSLSCSFARANYRSNHEAGVFDAFNTITLQGSYLISQQFKIELLIPYLANIRTAPGANVEKYGLGDIQFMTHWLWKKELSSSSEWMLNSDMGMGIKIPSGKFGGTLAVTGLPDNIHVGNGHYAYVLSPGLGVSNQHWGCWLSSNYLYNFKKTNSYRFGNQFNLQGLIYWKSIREKSIRIAPAMGMVYERSDNNQSISGFEVAETGGWGVLLPLVVSVQWNDLMFQSSYSIPLHQNYAGGGSELNAKWNLQLSIFL